MIWTRLPPKFGGVERVPAKTEVVEYLKGLSGTVRDDAERYVRFAPPQIDTDYRRRIEAALGWTAMVPTRERPKAAPSSRGSQQPALGEGHALIAGDDDMIQHAHLDKRAPGSASA